MPCIKNLQKNQRQKDNGASKCKEPNMYHMIFWRDNVKESNYDASIALNLLKFYLNLKPCDRLATNSFGSIFIWLKEHAFGRIKRPKCWSWELSNPLKGSGHLQLPLHPKRWFTLTYRRLREAWRCYNTWFIPHVSYNCTDLLGDATTVSTLNSNSSFWQVGIANRDRQKKVLATRLGLFQCIFCSLNWRAHQAHLSMQQT